MSRPKSRQVDAAFREEFTAMWVAGTDAIEMGNTFAIDRSTVYWWRRFLGLEQRYQKVPADHRERLRERHANGETWRVLAAEYGVSAKHMPKIVGPRACDPPPTCAYRCPRCGGRSSETAGHGHCTSLPAMQGVDRRSA